MTATMSSGTGSARISPQKQQMFTPRSGTGNTVGSLRRGFMGVEDHGLLKHSGEDVRLATIDAGPEDSREIRVLEQFLGQHVQQNKICEVQCMLLWNEWVRTFQRTTTGFPKLIREKEFRDVITDNFSIKIVNTISRGAIYPGLKFVP